MTAVMDDGGGGDLMELLGRRGVVWGKGRGKGCHGDEGEGIIHLNYFIYRCSDQFMVVVPQCQQTGSLFTTSNQKTSMSFPHE